MDTVITVKGKTVNADTITLQTGDSLSVEGNGKFVNNGSIVMFGATAVISTDIVGTGDISEHIGNDLHPSFLEFAGKVGDGQTINLDGTQMQIDDAKRFDGKIVFSEPPPPPGIGLEQVELKGVTATSSVFANGVLDVFTGHKLVAALRITAGNLLVVSSGGDTFITAPP